MLVKSISIPPLSLISNSPPLVKAVDVPDDALNEDLVLIHGCRGGRCAHLGLSQPSTTYPKPGLPHSLTDQGSKNEWCELGKHDRVGWTISFKDLQKTPGNSPQLVVIPKSSEGKPTLPQKQGYVGLLGWSLLLCRTSLGPTTLSFQLQYAT